jgi:hypothetical protein
VIETNKAFMATIALCPNCRTQLGLPAGASVDVELECPVCEAQFGRGSTAIYELPMARIAVPAVPAMDLNWKLPSAAINGAAGQGSPPEIPTYEPGEAQPSAASVIEPANLAVAAREELPDAAQSTPPAGQAQSPADALTLWLPASPAGAEPTTPEAQPAPGGEPFEADLNLDEFEDAAHHAADLGDAPRKPVAKSRRRGSRNEFVLRPSPKRRPRPSTYRSIAGAIVGGVGGLLLAGYVLVWLRGSQLDLFHMSSWVPQVLLPSSMQVAERNVDKAAGADEEESAEVDNSDGEPSLFTKSSVAIPTDETSILDMVGPPKPPQPAAEVAPDPADERPQVAAANPVEVDPAVALAANETSVVVPPESPSEPAADQSSDPPASDIATAEAPTDAAPAVDAPSDAAPPAEAPSDIAQSDRAPANDAAPTEDTEPAATAVAETAPAESPAVGEADPLVPIITPPSRVAASWPSTPIVGDLITPTFYSIADLTEAVNGVSEAGRAFLNGTLLPGAPRQQMGRAYIKLCSVVERLTMTDPAEYGSALFTQQALAKDPLHLVAGRPDRRDELAVIAASWWGYAKRQNNGMLFVGTVRELHVQGEWTECLMEIDDGQKRVLVPVLMDGVRFSTGREAAVAGLIVNEPQRNIAGYQGGAPQVLVAGYLFDPAKFADANVSSLPEFRLGD